MKNNTVEFTFDGKTYQLAADYKNNTCNWHDIDNPADVYDCALEDPGYYIAPDDESPLYAAFFFQLLGAQDHQKMAAFLIRFNESLRKILPPGHEKYCEVSPRLADYL